MTIAALRLLLAVLGLTAIGICLSILAFGSATTAGFFEAQFNALTGSSHPLTGAWPATMDSELRFYAVFWGAYGIILLCVAHDLSDKLHLVPPLAALFFIAGIGRVVSYVAVGSPHPFFTFLMVTELLLPLVFLALWHRARSSN
jgi:hypothetical protein